MITLQKIKSIVYTNISLLLIVLGAGSNFFLILLFKKFIPESFNTFSLFLTYIAIVASFGLLGFDQVFLRLSKIKKERIEVGRDIFTFMILSLLISPFFFSWYFSFKYLELNFFSLLISGISVNAIIIAYNLFRLRKKFVVSQSFMSGYKLAFLIGVSFLFVFKQELSIASIINLLTGILCVFGLTSLVFVFKDIKALSVKTPSLFSFFLSFSFNIGLITLLGFGERILIANELGENVFGKYFYYSTVFLFPLTLLQQYIGFKDLVYFKERIDKEKIVLKIKRILVLGISIILLIIIAVIIDNGLFLDIDLKTDMVLIMLLSSLGIIKLLYGLFSAILGAKANVKDLYFINVVTLLIAVFFLVILFTWGISLYLIIISLIAVFLSRSLFIYLRLVK